MWMGSETTGREERFDQQKVKVNSKPLAGTEHSRFPADPGQSAVRTRSSKYRRAFLCPGTTITQHMLQND